jgi:hypothetical protein
MLSNAWFDIPAGPVQVEGFNSLTEATLNFLNDAGLIFAVAESASDVCLDFGCDEAARPYARYR